MSDYVIAPPVIAAVPIKGSRQMFPVRRIFCVGRNYAEHAIEMGSDPTREPPFYFAKPADALVVNGADMPYPPMSKSLHHEMELVVAIGAPGFRVDENNAAALVYGYACGLDMTRRDLQLVARDKGRPWDLGKDVEQSSVVSEIVPMPGVLLEQGELVMTVNGQPRQKSDLNMLIWNIRELIVDLSKFYHLQPGDLIFTGTPEGVGAVVAGDRIEGHVAGVGEITLQVGAAE